MAEIQESIVGFELGPFVPPSGITYGWLVSPNSYVAGDIQTGAKRSGSYGLNSKVTSAAIAGPAGRIQLLPANTALPSTNGIRWELRVRYFFRIATLPSANNLIISFTGSGTNAFELTMQMDTTGQLRALPSLCGNTTSAYSGVLATNTWYQVQEAIFGLGSSAGGTVAIGLRESSHTLVVYDEAGDNIIAAFGESSTVGQNMPAVWPAVVDLGQATGTASCTREIHYDDFWCHMVTDTDALDLEWPRGTAVEIYAPTANGATNDFTRGGVNTGANWSQVSEIPKTSGGGTEFISSATAGQVDLYQHAALADPDDVVYHIQALAFVLDNTTPQQLQIGSTLYDVATREGVGVPRYALAHQIYSNAFTLSRTDFNALEFGIKKKTAGGTTLFSEQEFLEVLTGPPNIITDDMIFDTTLAFDAIGGLLYNDADITLALTTLGYRLNGPGVEINVPTPWNVQQIQVGYRDEETA